MSSPPSAGAKSLHIKLLAAEPPSASADLDAQAYLERFRLRQYSLALADFNRAGALAPQRRPWEEVVRPYSQAIARNPQDAR